ncbi:tripartite tricarboxylate transporter TctB family protein [Rhizobium sp. TRM95111]|uniref:tripartite tricarboxylate transporter TctB family protein n=1 Tax=Rhizobium alarense TaxID=2846851 RepID=UPI001F35FF01|nr:tripartite tricarboxylate transporter TctB family protein [Rhizobium alarense]MCF3640177.1 tripartite tricarboxylate transporter TctB family protein [Rhizobium alarense]
MHDDIHTRRPGELAFNAVLLAFSLFMFWQAYNISGFSALSSAGAFPMAMTAIMSLTAAIALLRSWRLPSAQGGFALFRKEILPSAVVVFSLFIFAYSVLLESLGFVLASFLFLMVSTWFLEGGRLKRALLLSLVSIVCVYIVFRVIFQVVLPEGVIPERSIMAGIVALLGGGN